MIEHEIVIIGAGPTGLGAAYRLHELKHGDFAVLEANAHPGGLASSYVDDVGFTWDVGGHVHFSHYPEYDRMIASVLGDNVLIHDRQSWIWFKGRLIPYPFQHNLHYLDEPDRDRAITGLRSASAIKSQVSNFRTWIEQTFGHGIADLFMIPYNRKVWGYPLETLDWTWIGDRVASPDVPDVRDDARPRDNETAWGPNRRFFYPARGGTGSIWRGVASTLPADRLWWNAKVTSIDVTRRLVTLDDGRSLTYGSLVSTMPMDVLTERAQGLDSGTVRLASHLVYSSVHVVGVGLRGPQPSALHKKCWIYFPHSDCPFHRITVLSNYSRHNAPAEDGYWSMMAEVCETRFRPVDVMTITGDVIRALRQNGMLPDETVVVSQWHHREERGYPTPFLNRHVVLNALRSAFEHYNVYSRGRFGAWLYEVSNQDHSFMQGREVIDRLLGVGNEITIDRPNEVNRRVTAPVEPPPEAANSSDG